MATLIHGAQKWSLNRNEKGEREYGISWLIEADETEGPYTVLQTPGLPLPGSTWNFFDDNDPWAYCRPTCQLQQWQHSEKDGPWRWWQVTQTFSTLPLIRCQDTTVENPLLEPPVISGTFVQETKEAVYDLEGKPLLTSSHERYRGSNVEFDFARPTIHIEHNVANLELPLLAELINKVNSVPMWGLDVRCVKLSQISWQKQYYGSCQPYYKRTFDFDIRFETFDRLLLDEGSKALNGEWDQRTGKYKIKPIQHFGEDGVTVVSEEVPDPKNPQHFCRYKDRYGENARVILNGAGLPAETVVVNLGEDPNDVDPEEEPDPDSGDPGRRLIRFYKPENLFLLGLPASF